MSAANLRVQFQRGHWRVFGQELGKEYGGRPPASNGNAHLFSIYDALGIALARQLTLHGVAPTQAFTRAMLDFAHTGDARREPGGVFDPAKFGLTFYVYSPGAGVGDCVCSKEISDPIQLLIPPMHNRASSAIIIDLNELRERVFKSLGLDPRHYE